MVDTRHRLREVSLNKLLHKQSVISRDDLAAVLLESRVDVPERGAGRTSDHTEPWVFAHLLSTMSAAGELSFPLTLEKGERPDYVLSGANGERGVEVSELVPAALAQAVKIRNKEFPDARVDSSLFKPGVSHRPREEVRSLLRDCASGFGWEADSVEREWAQACGERAANKVQALASRGYSLYPENWLLLYDNLPGPDLSLDTAAGLAYQELRLCFGAQPGFCRVVVLSHAHLVEFRANSMRVLAVVPPWADA